jgi:hypothetical protein
MESKLPTNSAPRPKAVVKPRFRGARNRVKLDIARAISQRRVSWKESKADIEAARGLWQLAEASGRPLGKTEALAKHEALRRARSKMLLPWSKIR